MMNVLMVGAINVIRRRTKGVTLCKIWAWFTIPWSVLGFIVNMYVQMQIPKDAQQGGPVGQYIGLAFATCMTLVLGIGVPVFLLAWFSRQKISDEIASWSDESQQVI